MALDTYANLKLAIADWLDRDDLTDQIDDFIDLAEVAHRDEVRFRELLVRDTLTLAAGERTVALPADFASMKYIRFLNPVTNLSNRYYLPKLVQVSEDELTDMATQRTEMPKYFSVEDVIEFDCESDREYTGQILYYKVMTPLDDANPVNELLTRAADLYLYGALRESAPFLEHDDRIGTWNGLYEQKLDRLNLNERTNRHSGPQVSRVAGQNRRKRANW